MSDPTAGTSRGRWRGGATLALLLMATLPGAALGQATSGGAAPHTAVDPASAPREASPEARAPEPLSLEEALREARRSNVELRRQGARLERARAEARTAGSPLWPSLGAESGWTRTSDPVGVFGTKLRQGRFGQDDLSVDALNDPLPVEDWSTALRIRWEVASPKAWAGRSSARRAVEAEAWREVRTREGTDLATRVHFRRAQGGEAAVAAARAALEAARQTEVLFGRRHREGLLTRADVLQARAERERAAAALARAEAALHEARVRLALHLGREPDRLPDPRGPLPGPEEAEAAAGFDPSRRADLRARAAAVEAAESAVIRARLGYLPDLGAFAGWSVHGDGPFASDGTDWSVGLSLRWELFTGFRRAGETGRARAELTATRLAYGQAVREARGEVVTARRSLTAARTELEASRAAREAAEESRSLMRRRLEEGLATPADLLQAEARANAARAEVVEALVRYHVAAARLDFAQHDARPEEIR